MHDGGMITASDGSADLLQRSIGFFAHEIHSHLARPYHLTFAPFATNAFNFDIIVAIDSLEYLGDGESGKRLTFAVNMLKRLGGNADRECNIVQGSIRNDAIERTFQFTYTAAFVT